MLQCICRLGTQYCEVICIDLNHDTGTIRDEFCNSSARPAQEGSSGTDQCNDSGWQFGPWSKVTTWYCMQDKYVSLSVAVF